MANSLPELLAQYLPGDLATNLRTSPTISSYLSELTGRSLANLRSVESQGLAHPSHLHGFASRAYQDIIQSSDELLTLHESIPQISSLATTLKEAIPKLDELAVNFSSTYGRSNTENALLDRRKRAILLSQNKDRISDILELPTLLASTITQASTAAGTGTNYSSALDLFAHIKRLQNLYPESAVVRSVLVEAQDAMDSMITQLISNLRGQNIRLASAIRTLGFLRRVAPDLSNPNVSTKDAAGSDESLLGSLFLTARLANLLTMLEALSPLRDIADQETARRLSQAQVQSTTAGPTAPLRAGQKHSADPYSSSYSRPFSGTQTERYLKRYIEIFREQSFATVSMYGNIFASSNNTAESTADDSPRPVLSLPSALSTFPLTLLTLLTETLRSHLPNVSDPAARESLLIQVLYTAGSLGRLGADFSMIISLLDDEDDDFEEGNEDMTEDGEADGSDVASDPENKLAEAEGSDALSSPKLTTKRPQGADADQSHIPEWVRVMKKHRIQAGRIEALAAGQEQDLRRGPLETVVK